MWNPMRNPHFSPHVCSPRFSGHSQHHCGGRSRLYRLLWRLGRVEHRRCDVRRSHGRQQWAEAAWPRFQPIPASKFGRKFGRCFAGWPIKERWISAGDFGVGFWKKHRKYVDLTIKKVPWNFRNPFQMVMSHDLTVNKLDSSKVRAWHAAKKWGCGQCALSTLTAGWRVTSRTSPMV